LCVAPPPRRRSLVVPPPPCRHRARSAPPPPQLSKAELHELRCEKLIFFEGVFFDLDEDSSLFIDAAECDMLLSFTALDLDPNEREAVLAKYDFNGDGRLNRVEFCMLCEQHLWDVPMHTVERALKNMKCASKGVRRRNNTHWRHVANSLDKWGRILVPFCYFLTLILVFNLDLTDKYAVDPTAPMFSGLGPASLSDSGVAYLCLYLATAIGMGVAGHAMRKVAEQTAQQQAAAMKEAARFAASAAGSPRPPRLSDHLSAFVSDSSLNRPPTGNPSRGFGRARVSTGAELSTVAELVSGKV